MPVFDYTCKHCNKIWNVLIKNSEEMEKISCPDCNSSGKDIQRLWGNVYAQVKLGRCGNSKDGYTGVSGGYNQPPVSEKKK